MKKNLKKVMAFVMALAMIVTGTNWTVVQINAAGLISKQPDVGIGTEASPYEIDEASELLWFAETVNGGSTTIHAVLTADIDMNPGYTFAEDGTYTTDGSAGELVTWTPIGNSSNQFSGTFDGRGNFVSGLYTNDSAKEYVGLFGSCNAATISNVGVTDNYFRGSLYVGGICGSGASEISNCYHTGIVVGELIVGGIAGISGIIEDCYNAGYVKGSNMVGGIAGSNGQITNCYNTGNIVGGYETGGITGTKGLVSKSYNSGEVEGGMVTGGISGTVETITNCYNIGEVTGTDAIGGIGGYMNSTSAIISGCFNTREISGNQDIGMILGAMWDGTLENNYYMENSETDSLEGTLYKPASQFASGEVAYLLQAAQTDTEIVWGQLIGEEAYPVLEGTKVYNVENCNTGQYSNVNESKAHNLIDGVCVVCGEGEDVNLSGYTISLTGNIAINFHIQLSEKVLSDSSAYMLFTFADGDTSKVKVSDAELKTDGSKTYYILTCEVQAPEINDEFTAQVITTVCETEVYTYSVKTYADYILKNTEGNEEYTKATPMVKAMLNYGGYVQKQFGHNTDALANADLYTETEDPVLVGTVPTLEAYAFTAPTKNVGVKYYGTSLLLNSETTIRHYFTFTEGEDIDEIRDKYEFKLADGTILTPVMRGGMIYIDIKDINAADLDVKYEVTVTNTESSETITFSYSALSYAKYVLDYTLAGTNLVNVIKAMYFYNEAANAYFG